MGVYYCLCFRCSPSIVVVVGPGISSLQPLFFRVTLITIIFFSSKRCWKVCHTNLFLETTVLPVFFVRFCFALLQALVAFSLRHTHVNQARQLSSQLEVEAGDCDALRARLQAMEKENGIR